VDFVEYFVTQNFPKLSFGTALIAFLLPFFLVKCQNETIMTIKGINTVTGVAPDNNLGGGMGDLFEGLEDEMEDAAEKAPKQKKKRSLWGILALLAAIAGLGLSFTDMDNKKMLQTICGVLGVVSLILLYIGAKGSMDKEAAQMGIKIVPGIGFYLSFLGFLAATIWINKKQAEGQNLQSAATAVASAAPIVKATSEEE